MKYSHLGRETDRQTDNSCQLVNKYLPNHLFDIYIYNGEHTQCAIRERLTKQIYLLFC